MVALSRSPSRDASKRLRVLMPDEVDCFSPGSSSGSVPNVHDGFVRAFHAGWPDDPVGVQAAKSWGMHPLSSPELPDAGEACGGDEVGRAREIARMIADAVTFVGLALLSGSAVVLGIVAWALYALVPWVLVGGLACVLVAGIAVAHVSLQSFWEEDMDLWP